MADGKASVGDAANDRGVAIAAVVFAAAMCAMSLASRAAGLAAMKLAAAGVATAALGAMIAFCRQPRALLALRRMPPQPALNMAIYLAWGVAIGAAYRSVQGQTLWPAELTYVAAAAGGIGMLEEVAYRGFVQGAWARLGPWTAVALAAAAHAAYKSCLLVGASSFADIALLAGGTLLFGLGLGRARLKYDSLILPCLAHVAFDVLAYGDRAALPWWTR